MDSIKGAHNNHQQCFPTRMPVEREVLAATKVADALCDQLGPSRVATNVRQLTKHEGRH